MIQLSSEIAVVFTRYPPGSLPPPSGSESERDTQKASLRKAQQRVIVVDDEALIADTLVEILRENGYEAIAVYSGSSAVDLAQDWKPDIVISDVVMPGLNGIEAGLSIKRLLPYCRILLLSGQAATAALLQVTPGADTLEVLAKPVKPEVLLAKLRRA